MAAVKTHHKPLREKRVRDALADLNEPVAFKNKVIDALQKDITASRDRNYRHLKRYDRP